MKLPLLALLLALTARAGAMTLEDPARQAGALRSYFPERAGHGFACGVPVRFSQGVYRCDIQCEKNPCRSECRPSAARSFLAQAEGCEGETLEVVSEISWLTRITPGLPKKYGQTWLEELIGSADFFIVPSGTMQIKFVLPGPPARLVDESGDEVPLETVLVLLDYRQVPGGPAIEFQVLLDRRQTGLNQLLYFGQRDPRDYFIKKWGLLL